MTKLIPKKQTAWGKLEYKGPQYSQVIELMKKEDPQAYNRLLVANARSLQPNSEVVRYKNAKGKELTSTTNIGMSGTDPIGLLYIEGVALNPIFKGLGRVAEYGLAKAGNKWARAKVLSREMLDISTSNKTIPNNVGWAPKQTINVKHASNKNELPNLYFEKRWDVVNEGANPHGIWYQGKLGIPRTDLTNPGKGAKALKARDLFANRPYQFKGNITFEKPMQTIGDVKNRSLLSYDADNMGADGLIYNDIYDNGYNHNLVILGWKQFNSRAISKNKTIKPRKPTAALVFKGSNSDKSLANDYNFFTTDPNYASLYGKVTKGIIGFKNPAFTKQPLVYKDMEQLHFYLDDNLRRKGLPLSDVIIGKDKVTKEVLPNGKILLPSKGIEYVIWNPKLWMPLK